MSTIDTGNTFLGFASLYWISTIMIICTCLIFGYKRLLCLSFKPELIWDIIEMYRVSSAYTPYVDTITIMFILR